MSIPPHAVRRRRAALLAPVAAAVLLWLAGCAAPGTRLSGSLSGEAGEGQQSASTAPADATPAPVNPPIVALSSDAGTDPDGPAVAAPVDPLRPNVRVNLDDRNAQLDLWARVIQGFGIPDLDTDLVHVNEQWYATRPDYVQRMTERGGRYMYHIVEEVQKRGMPTELALLPFIESAFNPQAMSVANASGMWQFVPSTGRDFSLKQNIFRDDRRDVLASTKAALDYLGRLNAEFNDWQLTLAAYNWGVGNVRRAIARNQRDGLPTDYLSLRMPEETRNYVPKLQAVKNIVLHPDSFALSLPALENHPYFLSVPIERDIDVDLAARLAGLSTDQFKQLNPQMNKPVILAAGTPQVLLPYDNASVFVHNIGQHRGPLASWTAWVAEKTLRPGDAARQLGVSEDLLREVNHIPPRMLVKAGSTLLVPRSEQKQDDVPSQLVDNAVMALAPDVPPQRRITIRAARKGETVVAIAKRFHLAPEQVADWNKVAASASFKGGQSVALYVPNTPKPRTVAPPVRVASDKPVAAKPAAVPVSVRRAQTHGPHNAPTRSVASSTRAAGPSNRVNLAAK